MASPDHPGRRMIGPRGSAEPRSVGMYSRRDFLRSSATVAGLGAAGVLFKAPAWERARGSALGLGARQGNGTAGGRRTVDFLWESFFDSPMPYDVWQQREEVGYVGVRSFEYPMVTTWADVAGPELYPNIAAPNYVYCPGRLKINARNVPKITIDSIGGVNSPAPKGSVVGFVPYNLMGELGAPPSGGTAQLSGHLGYLDRGRAEELRYPSLFGYHGWENEVLATVRADGAGLRKILGIAISEPAAVLAWWATNRKKVEQAWWYWLFDEGGDFYDGGIGRLDVHYGFDVPLQFWLNALDLTHDPATGEFVLSWDWVNMAGDILLSRWISEGLGMGFVSNSYSDIFFDLRIGPTSSDLDLNTGQDYGLYKGLTGNQWVFEPARADYPDLTVEYLDESIYVSSARAYAGKKLGGTFFTYEPAAWDLRAGETLTFNWGDIAAKGKVKIDKVVTEPPAHAFPGRIDASPEHVRFTGPIDFTAWSKQHNAGAWHKLADPSHPQGLLPWGEPEVTFTISPASAKFSPLLANAPKFPAEPKIDEHGAVPPFPKPLLSKTPPLPSSGRTMKVDFYSMLRPYMNRERWLQYEVNDYQRGVRFEFPVEYHSSPYFVSPNPADIVPYSYLYSGMRMHLEGRRLPEITIDSIGGGDQPAGFLPRNLMGGLAPGVHGGTATLESHLAYGSRAREAIYRQQQWWGFYGWENFWDVDLTMDAAAAQKVLGITADQFASFRAWLETHVDDLRYAWREWFYAEFRRVNPMAWFNYPEQIWGFPIEVVSADAHQVKLHMSVLNEAHDALIGRWFIQTFLPHAEASWDDLHLQMKIGPSHSDVLIDANLDWSLFGSGSEADRKWQYQPFLGDNPYLANEYREKDSPAFLYYPQPGFQQVPSAWDLREGEQLNFHYSDAGLKLLGVRPGPKDFPGQIVKGDGVVSLTGPLNLLKWSKTAFGKGWAKTGGLLPIGLPIVNLA